jgi:DNA topoisomerase III
MTRLYLCEKPSQAKDIGVVLGATARKDGYYMGSNVVVTWCFGHLLELAMPEEYNTAYKEWKTELLPIVPEKWKLSIKSSARKQFDAIKMLLSSASEVVLATDADREGETIGREVLDLCRWRGPLKRLWLSALDAASISKALAQLWPGEKTYPLYLAGLARQRADWLIGINLTRLYTVLGRGHGISGVLSVGRVQTPTLALVVERDRAIERFVPKDFFDVCVDCAAGASHFSAKWVPGNSGALDDEGRCTALPHAEAVCKQVQGQSASVRRYETEQKSEPPPLPFDLATLQLIASQRWGFSAQEVLSLAQSLYETHKATTYPRTDCRYMPESQHTEAVNIIATVLQCDLSLQPLKNSIDASRRSRAWNDDKITAHHAIIPTEARVDISKMSADELKLYALIRMRYLAQFMPDFTYDQTVIELACGGQPFEAKGRVTRIAGWRGAMSNEVDAENEGEAHQALPQLVKGQSVLIQDARVIAKRTQPPAQFTDGTLIRAMKNVAQMEQDPTLRKVLRDTSGIGTETTRPNIIETLIARGYLERVVKKALVSTSLGRTLIDIVPGEIKSVGATALQEQFLDDIAQSKKSLSDFMDQRKYAVTALVQASQALAPASMAKLAGDQPLCPKCGARLVQRKGRQGSAFLGCSAWPACAHTQCEGAPASKSVTVSHRRRIRRRNEATV